MLLIKLQIPSSITSSHVDIKRHIKPRFLKEFCFWFGSSSPYWDNPHKDKTLNFGPNLLKTKTKTTINWRHWRVNKSMRIPEESGFMDKVDGSGYILPLSSLPLPFSLNSFSLRVGTNLWPVGVNKARGKWYLTGLKNQKTEFRASKAAGKWRENPKKERIRQRKPPILSKLCVNLWLISESCMNKELIFFFKKINI